MKKLLAIAVAIVMTLDSTASFADTVNKTLTLKFTAPSNVVFSLDFYQVSGTTMTPITDLTINKGTINPGTAGINVEFGNLAMKVTNNTFANFTITTTCSNFVSDINPSTNIMPIWGWSGKPTTGTMIPAGTLKDLSTVTNLGTAGAQTLYTSSGIEREIMINLAFGAFVPANARGGNYTSTVQFVLASL